MKVKFNLIAVLFLMSVGFVSCENDPEPQLVTYTVNSGSDDLAVFVYDTNYQDDNKCVPDFIRRVPAKNGVYETQVLVWPDTQLGLYVVFPNGTKGKSKLVISSNGTILFRSEGGHFGSVKVNGTLSEDFVKTNYKSANICDSPMWEN